MSQSETVIDTPTYISEALRQVGGLKLNDGNVVPLIGFGVGTSLSNEAEGKVNRTLIENVKMAIRRGYHHLDGAQSYCNETELGIAIQECGVPREVLYITTKVNVINLPTRVPDIPASFTASLEKLKVDYVDQYLIHSPFWADSDEELQKAWKDMEDIRDSGKARSVGVSNYLTSHLEATLRTAMIIPAINQIEFHPYLQHGPLIPYCRARGIALSAYSPQTQVFKARPGPVDDRSSQLAEKYGVTEGAIALRWVLDQGIVAITTSTKEDRLREYIKATTFELLPEEVEELKVLGEQKHYRGFWLEELGPDSRA